MTEESTLSVNSAKNLNLTELDERDSSVALLPQNDKGHLLKTGRYTEGK